MRTSQEERERERRDREHARRMAQEAARRRRRRLIGLIGLGVLTVAVAVLTYVVVGLTLAGTTLILCVMAAAIMVVTLLPEATSPPWPRAQAVERGGRRSEIHRLSWNAGDTHRSSELLRSRLVATLETRAASAAPHDAQVLRGIRDGLRAKAGMGPVERALDALDRLEAQDARNDSDRTAPEGAI